MSRLCLCVMFQCTVAHGKHSLQYSVRFGFQRFDFVPIFELSIALKYAFQMCID